jgi:hypothetical protein
MHPQVCLFLRWSHSRRSEIHSADSICLAKATTVLKQRVNMLPRMWLQLHAKRARGMINRNAHGMESCGDMRWIGGQSQVTILKLSCILGF